MIKTLKIHTPLVRFALYFHYRAVFQKIECSFFDQVAIVAKSASTFENCTLVAELKFKCHRMSDFLCFQFQLCQQRAVFKCQYTNNIYGHLVKKATFKFLKDGPVIKLSAKM